MHNSILLILAIDNVHKLNCSMESVRYKSTALNARLHVIYILIFSLSVSIKLKMYYIGLYFRPLTIADLYEGL